jgi:hypothetical protein
MVVQLSQEAGVDPPPWALRDHFLDRPWFVAEMDSLRAMALVESPLAFRRNHIFVLGNLLARA